MGVHGAHKPRHAEIGDSGFQIIVQQHIAGLHVSVDYMWNAAVVEKSQSASCADGNFPPRRPVQSYSCLVLVVENVFQASIFHIFVYQKPFFSNFTVA
ncbi:hypothetical protein IEQ34_010729 [Dendrobium chrysotoxum]|uniref:Uncharacterized protein n=1 Tax=Dendrobium chrysotoxum TaxID=161865 RepID=A0AAV7GTK9_DENCH|nr:hypothetical protein IEQ34_010729 [Dendrobium chrysotoxum]